MAGGRVMYFNIACVPACRTKAAEDRRIPGRCREDRACHFFPRGPGVRQSSAAFEPCAFVVGVQRWLDA